MSLNWVTAAAANNAAWCDAVCRSHGHPGEFSSMLWLNRAEVPQFYPNAVTLTPLDGERQRELISGLALPGSWAVKDSFATLELGGWGFTELFAAEWIGLRLAEPVASTARWVTIRDETLLARWEAAWRGPSGEPPLDPPQVIFRPALLEDPNVRILAAYHEEALVAGAIAYRAAGVVSLSNTFFTEAAPEALRAELLAQATAALPGLPLVGYEHGSELSTWLSHGFESMGPLRVWLKRSSEDC